MTSKSKVRELFWGWTDDGQTTEQRRVIDDGAVKKHVPRGGSDDQSIGYDDTDRSAHSAARAATKQ